MYLRMTDLLVDLLDRYEPETGDEASSDLVTEEAAGVEAYGQWTLLADASIEEAEGVVALIERLGLAEDEEFEMSEGILSFMADGLVNEDLVSLLEAVDAACDLLEVSGELDAHERSITWMGTGDQVEPMPMPVPRPGDEIPLLVEEVAIHLRRHEAAPVTREGMYATYGEGVEVFGAAYVLLRDEIEDEAAVREALAAAGVPAPQEVRSHRIEWDADALRPADLYRATHALKPISPVVGFAGGITWRNEPLQVEEPSP